MWARKRIDIRLRDLVSGLMGCAFPRNRTHSQSSIRQSFAKSHPDSQTAYVGQVCFLSIRSGFDLLLQTLLDPKPKSDQEPTGPFTCENLNGQPDRGEIIFSALTIDDMPRIAQTHGFQIVAADIDAKTLWPLADEIESKITSHTQAIVVAQLMGGLGDIEPIAKLAKKYGIILIEDCAQAYLGNHYTGSELADVSMFSFGSIKTNTALGGAVFFVRSRNLKSKLRNNHLRWSTQSNLAFFKRILKYGFVKTISTWPVAWAIRNGFRQLGSNHDAKAASMAKGFSGGDFFRKIRQQPSSALLGLMAKRISEFTPESIKTRSSRGELLRQTISSFNGDILVLGSLSISPTYWVFAVLVENPKQLAIRLWDAGFDATTQSSLRPVETSVNTISDAASCKANFEAALNSNCDTQYESSTAQTIYDQVLFLPIDLPMPKRELIRMGKIVGQFGHPTAARAKTDKRISPEKSLVKTAILET